MKYLLFIIFSFVTLLADAQNDSAITQPQRRVVPRRTPARTVLTRQKPVIDTIKVDTARLDSAIRDTTIKDTLTAIPYVPFRDSIQPRLKLPLFSDSLKYFKRTIFHFTEPIRYTVTQRIWRGKEAVFYSIIALLIFFALIKNAFNRYFLDLYRIFFRTSMRHRQIKEQLQQSPLPSLLFNVFFVLCIAMFLALAFQHFGFAEGFNFWLLFLYAAIGLAAIYSIKYITLKLVGWILGAQEAAGTYIFIVFTTNKVIGISILPLLVVAAFTSGWVNEVAIDIALVLIVCAFVYRYLLSYVSVNRLLHINIFHFFLYLLAFEILPLLLINKVLFILLGKLY